MDEARSFAPLLIVLLLAFVVPILLSRLRRFALPIVVGEIIAGILVGRSGMGWVTPGEPMLTILSEFGFVFLMFLSGMEIDFDSLRRNGTGGAPKDGPKSGLLSLALLSFGLTLLLATACGFALRYFGLARDPWIMALILSTTSLGVVVPVLKERGIITQPLGQAILLSAVVADFATMLLITVAVTMFSHGLTAKILLVVLLFVAFFFALHFGALLNKVSALRRSIEELSHATAQIKVRASFFLMMIFVALSEALGAEVILGAFLAGAIVALLRTPDEAELVHQLEAVGFGFFIPIFFIMVGVGLDLPLLFRSESALWLVPLLVLSAIMVKLVPALIFTLSFTFKEALAAGTLLSARLSLIIAAAAIGARIGIIGESTRAAIILVAIATVMLAPSIFVRLVAGRSTSRSRPIAVAGSEELGLQVADNLTAHHERVVVADFDEKRLARAAQRGFETVKVSVDWRDKEADKVCETARALVCTYDDSRLALRVCRIAKELFKLEHVVAQVADPADLPRFEALGVTTTNATRDRSRLMSLLTRNPGMYALLSRTDDDKEISEVVVLNEAYVGKKLRQLDLPGDVLALALRREGVLLVPHGDTRLNRHDRLTLLGSISDVEFAQRAIGSNRRT